MNEIEVNGRITMLEAQRNAALNQTVIDAGTIAVLRAKVAELEAADVKSKPSDEKPEILKRRTR